MNKDVVYIHDGISSAMKKNNMNGPQGHYAKWNKSDGERQMPNDLIYIWNLQTKQKSRFTILRTDWWLPEVGDRGWVRWVKGVKRYKLWDFPGGSVVKSLSCSAGDTNSTPDWGTKILQAVEKLSSSAITREPMCCNERSQVPQLRPNAAK